MQGDVEWGSPSSVRSSKRKPPGSTYVRWILHSALTSLERASIKPSKAHIEVQEILSIGTLCEYRC